MAINPAKLPRHIGIIMDGNGRWAVKRLMPRSIGHRAGVKTLERIINAVFELGIPYLTVYAFSTENAARSEDEIQALADLIREYFAKKAAQFVKNEVRVRVIGDISFFAPDVRDIMTAVEQETASFTQKTFFVALNYGARAEILRAVNRAVSAGKPVTEAEFSALLDTQGAPDPDIIVRTGGEMRLSNFLMYQAAYAELFFLDDLWPDFNKKKLYGVLEAYAKRARRFGKISQETDRQDGSAPSKS